MIKEKSYVHIPHEDDIIQICPIPSNMRIVAKFGPDHESNEPAFDVPIIGLAVTRGGSAYYVPFDLDGISEEISFKQKNFIGYEQTWEGQY